MTSPHDRTNVPLCCFPALEPGTRDRKQEVYSECHPDEDEWSGEKMWMVLFGVLPDKA